MRIWLTVVSLVFCQLVWANTYDDALKAYNSKDYATAVLKFREAANAGNANAQFYLGAMFENGWGVAKKEEEAVRWYKLAALQGLVNAQFNLGAMYENGWGVAKDYEEAVRWYKLAAAQGDAEAKTKIAQLSAKVIAQLNSKVSISVPQKQSNLKYVSELSPDNFREKVLIPAMGKTEFDNFLYLYGFILSLNTEMLNDDYHDRQYKFAPYRNLITTSLSQMESVFSKIGIALNLQPAFVYKAFGIEPGKYIRASDEQLSRGRLKASKYWLHAPNDTFAWIDSKNPQVLLNEYYSKSLPKFNSDVSKIVTVARNYNDDQTQSQQKKDEREQWLKTNEGKQYLADLDAKKKAAEASRQKAEAEAAASLSKEFPFYAVVTCGLGGRHINIGACFFDRSGGSEIELTNGKEYGFFQARDIISGQVGQETQEGLRIYLKQNFNLKAQNVGDNLVLGIKIFKTASNELVFEKKTSRFGVIGVSN